MTPEQSPRRFTNDEVNAILKRALARQGGGSTGTLTYDDLQDTARELGIDPIQLQMAVAEQEQEGAMDAARAEWKVRRRKKFFEHLRVYTIINVFLVFISLATDSDPWFIWPLLGWGVGLMFDASDTFFPKDKALERGARRILAQQKRTETKAVRSKSGKSLTIDSKAGKIIIEKGDKRIEIG